MHLLVDAVVAEVAEATDRGVVKVSWIQLAVCFALSSLIAELAFIHLDADCLVRISERHPLECTPVDLLYSE